MNESCERPRARKAVCVCLFLLFFFYSSWVDEAIARVSNCSALIYFSSQKKGKGQKEMKT